MRFRIRVCPKCTHGDSFGTVEAVGARDVLRERFRQKALYPKFVGPVEHLIVSEEEISDED